MESLWKAGKHTKYIIQKQAYTQARIGKIFHKQ